MRRGLCRRSSAPRSPAPGSSTSSCATGGTRRRWRRSSMRGRASARALRGSASASRSRWSRPTRRGRSRSRRPGTARSATRSPACSPGPATRSSGSTTTTTRARRWSASGASVEAVRRGDEPPEDGYKGDYVARARQRPRRPGAGDAGADRGEPRAVPDPLRLVGAAEPARGAAAGAVAPAGHVRARRRALGPVVRRTATTRTGCCSAPRRGEPTYRAADVVYLVDKLERGFDRAIYVLGADHHGTRNWYAAVARMLGYDPERVEVLLYQLVHLTRGGEQTKMSKRRGDVVFLDDFIDEIGVDAARWYLVNRSPDQTIEIDVDLAAERPEKNPVYYVQYAHARIAGILRNAGGAEGSAAALGAARAGGARPGQAAAGVPRGRRGGGRAARTARDPDVRDPRRRRLPPLLPPPPGARERTLRRSGSVCAGRPGR